VVGVRAGAIECKWLGATSRSSHSPRPPPLPMAGQEGTLPEVAPCTCQAVPTPLQAWPVGTEQAPGATHAACGQARARRAGRQPGPAHDRVLLPHLLDAALSAWLLR
jgi:hypothetical protein